MITQDVQKFIKSALNIVSDQGIKQCITLTEGKSDAEVYRMCIISRRSRNNGTYIVKLVDTEGIWYDADRNEASKAVAIWTHKTPFKDKLVELCAEKVVGKYHVIIYRQANDSILNTVTIDKVKLSEKKEVLKLLSYDLLKKWNSNIDKFGSVKDIFANLLSYRLHPNGAFEKKVSSMLVDITASAFIMKNNIYPNPYYYIRNQEEWIHIISDMPFLKGNIHGDLHQKNIMYGKDGERDGQYFIIDYDAYQSEGYLFFDQTYLEMSIYFEMLQKYDAKHWDDAINLLFAKGVYEVIDGEVDEPLVYIRNSIYDGVKKWMVEEQPHMKDNVEVQFLIARIAAGINYISKGAIQNQDYLMKLLQYVGESFKALFAKIDFQWSTESLTKLNYTLSKDDYVETLWENCVCYAYNYVPILLTDDSYLKNDYKKIENILGIKWAFVVDIGKNVAPNDLTSFIVSKAKSRRNIYIYNLIASNTAINYSQNTCVWLSVKKDIQIPTYGVLWTQHQKVINDVFQQVLSQEGLKPILFVFDIRKGHAFAQKFLQCILNNYLRLKGSRIVTLGTNVITQEDVDTIKALGCHYFSENNASLVDLAETVSLYLPHTIEEPKGIEIILPTIDTIEPKSLTAKEINYYESSVELVYNGIEGQDEDTSFGEAFYRGEEISWLDLANDCDLKVFSNYEKKRDMLLKAVEEDSPRVKSIKLVHGAGTGGTTLSKRLLWDLKGSVPCMRLKRYTQDTANIILEISRKTGKRVFLTIEMGATILDGDGLTGLLAKVNEENGKLMVLQIERSSNRKTEEDEKDKEKPFIKIQDTLQDGIAREFSRRFRNMTNDDSRKHMLRNITEGNTSEWLEQRCPFFYGFYTFQEEYNLRNIKKTVQVCDQTMRDLLSDIALITIYSQNICVRFAELPVRLKKADDIKSQEIMHAYLLYEELDSSVRKLIISHEEGWRICHPLIAKQILCEIYDVKDYHECIYNASMLFVTRMYDLYGAKDEKVDRILRELFIDRSYIDSERTRFSNLIEDIETFTKRKELFSKLIELYPANPHYYNHLARLLVEQSTNVYDTAIDLLDTAINISEREMLNPMVHYITLGCIYCKSIYAYIREERLLQRSGRLAISLQDLIGQVREKCVVAESAFEKARHISKKLNSYAYFPQIQMESILIQKIVGYDKDNRSMGQLLREETEFETWYREHYGNAVQLFDEMQRHYEVYDKSYKDYLERAKSLIESLQINTDNIEQKLNMWNSQEGKVAIFCRRTYASSAYAYNGYSWDRMGEELLHIISLSMYQNVLQSFRDNIKQGDIFYWYESYRRLSDFDAGEVITFIEDYMVDDYEKEYLLFIMHFLQMEKGVSSAAEVVKHIARCKDMVPAGINNLSFRDVYSLSKKGSPIISYNYIAHEKSGSIAGLKQFKGAITEIRGNTAGTIQIDGMNLIATFVPLITDEYGRKREFTTENVTDRVSFNLMFAYSGLRAWNVDLES